MNLLNLKATNFFLLNVPEDKKFHCRDSGVCSNLSQLCSVLKSMEKDEFDYHVNLEKNDFSNWIYNVIGDIKLAEDLRYSKNSKDCFKKIKSRIKYLKKINTKK